MAESIIGGYFVYESGDVQITDYSGEDTIYIAEGEVDTYHCDGNDLVFTIGDGSLRIKDMKGRAVTFMNSDGDTTTQIYGGTSYSAQDVIKNLVKAWSKTLLTDTAKLDESIKLCSHFNGIQDAIDHMVADCRAAGNATTFLNKYCGIILDNIDTGAITGWDAGGSSVKTAAGVIPETSDVQHIANYANASFVRDGVTINIAEKLSSLTADGKKVLDGIYSWWAEEALKLIEESYGVEFKAAGDEINIALTPEATYSGLTSGTDVKINLQAVSFEDDDDYNGSGIDRTIAHEFTHIAQNLFLGYFPQFLHEGLADLTCGVDDKRKNYINYLAGRADSLASCLDVEKTGTGSAFHYAAGYMFYRYLAKQAADSYDSLTAHAWNDNVNISGTNDADFLTGNGSKQTLTAGKGNDTITAYGDSAQVQGDAGNDYILTNGKGLAAYGGLDNDTIKNRGDNSTCAGGADNDLLVNGEYWATERGGSNVVLDGGAGNDTLSNRASNVSVEGGKGDDVIYNGYRYYEPRGIFYALDEEDLASGYYTSDNVTFIYRAGDGNDTINGFNDTSTLSISGGVYSTTKSGSDIIVSVGDGSITLLGVASLSSVNIISAGYLTLTNSDSVKVTLGADIEVADASARTKGITIVGNKLDNSITGGSGNDAFTGGNGNDYLRGGKGADKLWGGSGDDTLIGETGNDMLYGGNGADTFIYRAGDGNDTINGFNDTSTLSISGSAYSTTKSGSDIIVSVGDGSITLLGAASLSSVNIVSAGYLTLTNSDSVKVTLGADIEVADASARTKGITIVGNKLDNSITGGSGNDAFTGGNGNDYLRGGKGADKLWGGSGDDTLIGETGNDMLYGGSGNDAFTGGNGNDYLRGDDGKDKIWGGSGNDTLIGGADNDSLWGGNGADTFLYADGDGKDVISGFDNDDMLQITGAFTTAYSSADNAIYIKVGSAYRSVTLKDFTASTFNINGDSYKLNGNKLIKF